MEKKVKLTSMEEYIEIINEYFRRRNITDTTDIFNAATYNSLASTYKVLNYVELINSNVYDKTNSYPSLLSIMCMIMGLDYFDILFDDNFNPESINEVIYVDTNVELPPKRISGTTLYMSFEMIYEHVYEYWDLNNKNEDLIGLKFYCIQKSDVEKILNYSRVHLPKIFLTVDVYNELEDIKNEIKY